MSDVFLNYIGGRWKPSHTGSTFERRNPATGKLDGVYTGSNFSDVDEAVTAAKKAFTS